MQLFSIICLSFITIMLWLTKTQGLCNHECDCQSEPIGCPAGVSLVTDGCNCCKVCAKQRGQRCNGYTDVCDPHKNLFCNFSMSQGSGWGKCSTQTGLSCIYEDMRMASGYMFEPSCKKRCWCMDGDIGCVALCSHETQPPREEVCPNARLQSVPEQCCDEWVCDTSDGTKVLSLAKFWSDYVKESDQPTPSKEDMLPTVQDSDLVSLDTNRVTSNVIYDSDGGNDGDELDYQLAYADLLATIQAEERDQENWHKTNLIPGDANALASLSASYQSKTQCHVQSSSWSYCSKTCGLGISTRVSNKNKKCQLMREVRLCMVRQCTDQPPTPKYGRKCTRQKRAAKRFHFTYAGCKSLRNFKPRFCGTCQDENRCCAPRETRTSKVRFRCPTGRFFYKNVMVIRNCRCHRRCSDVRPVNSYPGSVGVRGYDNGPVDS